MHHVIVGNSVAGMEAALALRARAPSHRITVVSAESPHPVARTAWMYVLAGQLRLQDTEFHERDVWARHRLDRLEGRVVAVDTEARRLTLQGGATLGYDQLCLAVGSRARPLPTPGAYDGPGVHHFVSLGELRALDAAAVPGAHAVVVGGGLIGVEVAEALHARGLHVRWLVREPWTWPVSLDRQEAGLVEAHVRSRGVEVRTGVEPRAIGRAGGRLHVGLDGDALEADLVVGAIGVVPNTAFLEGSGVRLTADGAVETRDDLTSVSAEGVWAAGDCASVPWIDGVRRPETLWYTARDQGRAAGAAMAGESVRYRRSAWINSAKFFDLEYTTAGFVPLATEPRRNPTPGRWQTWQSVLPEAPASLRVVLKDDRVVGLNALGRRFDTAVWMRWIQERRSLDHVRAHLADSAYDEELVPPLPWDARGTLMEGA